MGIFDDVVLNAKNAAQNVGKMAGQLVDMSKLRISLSEINGEIGRRFTELGQFVYEAKKTGVVDDAILAEKLAGIDDLYAQTAQISEQLDVLQNRSTCPVCGKKVAQDAAFCSACGAKLVREEPTPAEENEPCCCCEEAPKAEEKPEEEKPGE